MTWIFCLQNFTFCLSGFKYDHLTHKTIAIFQGVRRPFKEGSLCMHWHLLLEISYRPEDYLEVVRIKVLLSSHKDYLQCNNWICVEEVIFQDISWGQPLFTCYQIPNRSLEPLNLHLKYLLLTKIFMQATEADKHWNSHFINGRFESCMHDT